MNMRCLAFALALAYALALTACGPSGQAPPPNGEPCAPEGMTCNGNTAQTCQDGTFHTEACSDMCIEGLGCVVCEPGARSCNGDVSTTCKPDGTGFYQEHCDSLQGVDCSFETGLCEGPCSKAELGSSYIGCEYFP